MHSTTDPNRRPIADQALELIRLLRRLDSAEVAREAAETLARMLRSPDAPMVTVTALYSSAIVHYGRIFHDNRPYSEKRPRVEPGFRADVHEMLLNLRHKLVAHMDQHAATGNFGLVGRTIAVGSASVTIVSELSAQATGVAAPIDPAVAEAIRDHTAAVATHLERALRAAAKEIAALVIADSAAFVHALTEAGFVRTEEGTAGVTIDESRTVVFPPVSLSGPGRPIAEVAPDSQLFRHLVLEIRPKGESPTGFRFSSHLSDDDVIRIERRWLAHGRTQS